MHANAHRDIISPLALKSGSDTFMAQAAEDCYNTPLSAGEEWWEGLPVKKVLVTVGERECFRDDILEFSGKLGKGRDVEVFVGLKECHDGPIVGEMVGVRDGMSMLRILGWVGERVGI